MVDATQKGKLTEARIAGRRSVSRERGNLRGPAGSYTPIEALLVEDSLLNALVAIKYLTPFCAVDHTSCGADAVEHARAKQYDVILMDVDLGPGIDGIETLQRIRSIPGCEQIPVVALTGYSKPADRERLVGFGFSRYLAKPYIEEDLVSLIESVVVKR